MSKIHILVLFFYCFPFVCFAQKVYPFADTAYANQLLKESSQLFICEDMDMDLLFAKADTAQMIFEQLSGKDSKGVADALQNKLLYYRRTNKLTEAFAASEQLLNMRIKYYGENHAEVARVYWQLGRISRKMFKHDSALMYIQKSLAINTKLFGEIHNSVVEDYFELASIYTDKDKYTHAIICFEKVINIAPRINQSENYIPVQGSASNLSYIFSQSLYMLSYIFKMQKKFEDDKILLEKGLKILVSNKTLQDSFYTAVMYKDLSEIYGQTYDFENAFVYAEKALDLTRSTNPSSAYLNLGKLYRTKADYGKAIDMFYLSLKNIHPKAPIRIQMLRALAEVQFLKEEYDRALITLQQVWELDDRSPGVGDEFVKNYLAKGDTEKALYYSLESLEWTKKHKKGTMFRWQIESYFLLGDCYRKIKLYDKAIESYHTALKI